MASAGRSNPEIEENLTLHEMFRIVGDQMTPRDVRVLKYLYTGILSEDLRGLVHDGYSFLLALEKMGRVDSSNFKHILHVLRIITRHDLLQFVTLRRRKPVEPDPVDRYLEESARASVASGKRRLSRHDEPCTSSQSNCSVSSPDPRGAPPAKRLRRSVQQKSLQTSPIINASRKTENTPVPGDEIKKKVTCDIRLRVRAEYCHHDSALEGNVFSNKPDLVERQFEKFMQANTILKSRDLGSIICDIKFSELTYLDAFWRDYINGSLLEALKGVFITESLKQAVGHEAIKLLVNVDEDDYEAGRVKLLQNL